MCCTEKYVRLTTATLSFHLLTIGCYCVSIFGNVWWVVETQTTKRTIGLLRHCKKINETETCTWRNDILKFIEEDGKVMSYVHSKLFSLFMSCHWYILVRISILKYFACSQIITMQLNYKKNPIKNDFLRILRDFSGNSRTTSFLSATLWAKTCSMFRRGVLLISILYVWYDSKNASTKRSV